MDRIPMAYVKFGYTVNECLPFEYVNPCQMWRISWKRYETAWGKQAISFDVNLQ